MLAASNQVFVPDAFKEAANQDGGGGGKDRSARAPPKIEVFEQAPEAQRVGEVVIFKKHTGAYR